MWPSKAVWGESYKRRNGVEGIILRNIKYIRHPDCSKRGSEADDWSHGNPPFPSFQLPSNRTDTGRAIPGRSPTLSRGRARPRGRVVMSRIYGSTVQ